MATEPNTFVVGDVHGHRHKLLALLKKAGIVDDKGNRVDWESRVIQVGDLGHFGRGGNLTTDLTCYQSATEWFDTMLWGNHDRPVVDDHLSFGGYLDPREHSPELYNAVKMAHEKGNYSIATTSHGWLITHAGVAPKWDEFLPEAPHEAAIYINDNPLASLVTDVSYHRGGPHDAGGILWRDDSCEELSPKWKQIYGHTIGQAVRVQHGSSYNIDIGAKSHDQIAGIWLPSEEVVRVDEVDL